jgi:general secretion pathway protein N
VKKRYLITFAVVLWLALILSTIPASWAVYILQKNLPNWQIAGVSGNLWHGSAQKSQLLIDNKTFPLGELQWRLDPLGLLRLRPCISFSAHSQHQRLAADTCLSMLSHKFRLENGQFTINAAALEPWLAVRLRGDFDILLKSTVIKNKNFETIDGTITWQQAQFHNSKTWINLGDFQAHLTDNKAGGLQSRWTNSEQGPLTVDLTIEVPKKNSLRISGNITPHATAQPVIHETLHIIGKPDNQGGYAIDWRDH